MKKTTKNILTKLTYLVFIGLFMTLVISAKLMRDQQLVRDVNISIDHTSGNFFITEADVKKAISPEIPDSGALIHPKDLKDLETILENLPEVRESNVFVNNTGHLSIDVRQRDPLYRVIRPDLKSYYVDRDGYKFPVSSKFTARVPVVTGFVADNGKLTGKVESPRGKEVLELMQVISADKLWQAQFGQIDINSKGEIELLPRLGEQVVVFGSAENAADKLRRLRIFYHEGLNKAGWDTYKTINVKYRDQVICTK